MTTLELNPIRMRQERGGRLTPVACDFKCGFDRDDPRWSRLDLPPHLFSVDYSDFEAEINQLRTHQGQSDVYVINRRRHHPRADIRRRRQLAGHGNAGRRRDHLVGFRRQPAVREDEGSGTHLLPALAQAQANVLFIIGGKSNNTDIFETFRAMADALREHSAQHGPTPLYVVARPWWAESGAGHGRAARHAAIRSRLPYRLFGFDSDMSEVISVRAAGGCVDEGRRPGRNRRTDRRAGTEIEWLS